MTLNNEPNVKQDQKLLKIIIVTSLIAGIVAAIFFLAGNFFPSTKVKAAVPITYNISDALGTSSNDAAISAAVDGDTLKITGLYSVTADNSGLQNKSIILVLDGGNWNWAGKFKFYVGTNSKIILRNGNQLTASATNYGSNASIYFNTTKLVSYSGVGADYSFADVNTAGGVQLLGPLPVKLIRFETFLEKDKVNIKWATATEVNNDRFEVERSEDSKIWKQIGQVKGNGNSNKIIQYSFIDNPGVITSALYYRLRQVDYDGANEYGPVSVVNKNTREKAAKVYPNPANEVLNISLNKGSYNLLLMDINGKQIFSKNVDTDFEMIDTKIFPNGNYILKLDGDNVAETHRITIKH